MVLRNYIFEIELSRQFLTDLRLLFLICNTFDGSSDTGVKINLGRRRAANQHDSNDLEEIKPQDALSRSQRSSGHCIVSSTFIFKPALHLERVTETAAVVGIEVPHGFQQS